MDGARWVFDAAGVTAVLSTVLVITGRNAVHSLLSLVVSLLSVAVLFFLLGAPFAAALEIIIYAGAIMVMFVFVTMMLNLDTTAVREEEKNMRLSLWLPPLVLSLVLFGELIYVLFNIGAADRPGGAGPVETGAALFGPYLPAVEIAALLLLSALLGAYHLGRRDAVDDDPPRPLGAVDLDSPGAGDLGRGRGGTR